jgi:hypothetical protein
MKRSSGPWKPANLAESVHQRLNMYSLGVGAAGVSLLALTQPSEAKIVYTKVHHVIGTNGTYNLDLNHDGRPDFVLFNRSYHSTTPVRDSMRVSQLRRRGMGAVDNPIPS